MASKRPNVVLLSIDALHPDLAGNPEKFGLSLPNLTKIRREGAYASGGVKSVFPTFTYPCHQSMITGTHPATHGISNNLVFDPEGIHQGAWNWFVSDRVPTLWEMAHNNGYCVASSAFPASMCAPGSYIVPEFWRDGSELDRRFLHAVCVPQSLGPEAEAAIGHLPTGLDLTPKEDGIRKDLALWLLKEKLKKQDKPYFLSAYFASYDEMAHINGVLAPEALAALEMIDGFLGEFMAEMDGILCVVSDHGSLNVTRCIHPNALFYEAGLIEAGSGGKAGKWQAWSQRAGGISEVRLHDPADREVAEKVAAILQKLVDDPESGVFEVVPGEKARKDRKGFTEADFVIVADRGHEIRDDFDKPYKTEKLIQKAQHGFSEEYNEMRATFAISGPDVPPGSDVGCINLVDVAPTLAELMGFAMPTAEGVSVSPKMAP